MLRDFLDQNTQGTKFRQQFEKELNKSFKFDQGGMIQIEEGSRRFNQKRKNMTVKRLSPTSDSKGQYRQIESINENNEASRTIENALTSEQLEYLEQLREKGNDYLDHAG